MGVELNPSVCAQESALIPSGPTTPFPNHQIVTGKRDGINIVRNFSSGDVSQYVRVIPDYTNPMENATDIQTITYFSTDGRILNATLWLGGELKSDPARYGIDTLVYGLLVDSDINEVTGKHGVDFQREIQWNSDLGAWSTLFVEYASPEHSRILEQEQINFTNFFGPDQKYALIPLEMESITSPERFRVLYYTIGIYSDDGQQRNSSTSNMFDHNTSKILVDLSNWIDIPPPSYSFLTTPSPIEIVKGEEKEIGIQLVSSSGTLPDSVSFEPRLVSDPGISIEQVMPATTNETSGDAPASFRIGVSSEANIGLYSIPMLANFSTGSLFPSGFIELPGGVNLSLPAENFGSTYANLTFSVLETPPFAQTVKEFWVTYGIPVAILAGGVVGAFSNFFIDFLRNRRGGKQLKIN
ncbi:MAG TPA: hypothetical protein VE130_08835 [Nitrososphaeraceae archaeon]|nr:hypothetical protein [Nitrososphaeraceae archaeon]